MYGTPISSYTSMESNQTNTRPKKLIFIVDDDEDVLFHINYWFRKNNFLPFTYTNSKAMLSDLAHTLPDLILLDVNLRVEDGRKVCRYLKETLKLSVPILLFSAFSNPDYNFETDFADGFLEKDKDYYHLAEALAPFLFVTV